MTVDMVDVLSLLALKVKQNVFDISSGQYNVSIRDQIARGNLLARDLLKADPKVKSILIIGAGVVGVAAAERLLLDSASVDVTIIEQNSKAFHLQRGVKKRYVGPFMYEWPSAVHTDQSFPPINTNVWATNWKTLLNWKSKNPITASNLCKHLDRWLRDLKAKFAHRLRIHYGIDGYASVKEVWHFVNAAENAHRQYEVLGVPIPQHSFKISFKGKSKPVMAVDAGYLLLACGPGTEKVNHLGIKGVPFWSDDNLCDAVTTQNRTAILGGGDGALQDVLRALTGMGHPLMILKKLLRGKAAKKAVEAAYGDLLTAETQARLLQNWTSDKAVDARLDAACKHVAGTLAKNPTVCANLAGCVRTCATLAPGACVTQIINRTEFDRAYMLNRFLVHLINESQSNPSWPPGKLTYKLLSNAEVKEALFVGTKTLLRIEETISSSTTTEKLYLFDHAVVRHGLIEGTPATGKGSVGKFVQLTDRASSQRTNLGKIQLPFLVP